MLCPFKKKTVKSFIYSEEDTSALVEEETVESFLSCSYNKCPFYKQEGDKKAECLRVGEKQ